MTHSRTPNARPNHNGKGFLAYHGCPDCGATLQQTEKSDFCSCGYAEYYP